MKRVLGFVAVLAVAVALVLWRIPSTTERTAVEGREAPVARPEPQQTLDAPRTELSRAPGKAVPDSDAPIEGPPAPQRTASAGRAPIVLFGTLTDASGKAFRTVRGSLSVTCDRGYPRVASIDSGAYSIEGLTPGTIDVSVDAPGFRRVARTIALRTGETEHREDFALDPTWPIAVRFLTTDGRNFLDGGMERETLPGQKLWAIATEQPLSEHLTPGVSRERSPRSRWTRRSREDAQIAGDPKNERSGILDIDGIPPMYVSAVILDRVVATTLVDTPVDQVTIEIPLERLKALFCGVKGRVVDGGTQVPIPRATVTFSGAEIGRQFRTDADGQFAGEGFFPGVYTLSITRTPEYAADFRRIELAPDRQNDLGTLPLETGVPLRGRCVDPRGEPAQANIELSLYVPEHPFEFRRSNVGAETDASGRFDLGMCARRVYVLRVGPSRQAAGRAPDWRSKETVVDLTRGSIELVVPVHAAVDLIVRPATDEVRSARYWIFTPEGILASYGAFADGGSARHQLAPGSYKLLLGEEASIVREIPFTLGEELMTLDVAK